MTATAHPMAPSRADAVWLTFVGLTGALVFSVDVTAVSLSMLTVGLPALLVTATWRRSITDVHRRWAGRVLGTPIDAPYRRPDGTSVTRRVITTVRDPATWRDLLWLIVNSIVGVFLATLSISLLLGSVFYLIFPFLWAVTPPDVFATNFGIFEVHDQASSFAVMPLGVVSFLLWWFCSRPLLAVNARLARALLGPRHTATAAQVTCNVR